MKFGDQELYEIRFCLKSHLQSMNASRMYLFSQTFPTNNSEFDNLEIEEEIKEADPGNDSMSSTVKYDIQSASSMSSSGTSEDKVMVQIKQFKEISDF